MLQLPEKDELNWTKKQLIARLDVAMGGRAAEEMMFGAENVTSGASSDIESATRIAQALVMRFGMSDKVGPVLYREEDLSTLSPQTRNLIEEEVKGLLEVRTFSISFSLFFFLLSFLLCNPHFKIPP